MLSSKFSKDVAVLPVLRCQMSRINLPASPPLQTRELHLTFRMECQALEARPWLEPMRQWHKQERSYKPTLRNSWAEWATLSEHRMEKYKCSVIIAVTHRMELFRLREFIADRLQSLFNCGESFLNMTVFQMYRRDVHLFCLVY